MSRTSLYARRVVGKSQRDGIRGRVRGYDPRSRRPVKSGSNRHRSTAKSVYTTYVRVRVLCNYVFGKRPGRNVHTRSLGRRDDKARDIAEQPCYATTQSTIAAPLCVKSMSVLPRNRQRRYVPHGGSACDTKNKIIHPCVPRKNVRPVIISVF